MKKIIVLCIVLLAVVTIGARVDVKNPDKPLKGKWDFNIEKVWSIDKAGQEVFAKPRQLMVGNDGTIYLYDSQNRKFYMFSNDGKFIKSFAPKGEGPGEIIRFLEAFFAKDNIAIVGSQMIDFFDKNGNFIKRVNNSFNSKAPWGFLNEDEFISYPLINPNDANLKVGKISRVNLKTGKSKVFTTFSTFIGGYTDAGPRPIHVVIWGLTPMLISGYDSDRFYYGLNTKYEITAMDYNGKTLNTFSIEDRSKGVLSKEEEMNYVKVVQIPDEVLDDALKSIPNDILYFNRIDAVGGFIYVYNSHISHALTKQSIDIFSKEGKYLYRADIIPPKGFTILSGPRPVLAIKKNYLYMALESPGGELYLTKFEITLPNS